jgi:GNAT superfamily N-acetyltransferase
MSVYRKLLPTERDLLRRHLLGLAPAERRMRFQCAVSEDSIARHCARIDWFCTVVVGYFAEGRLRGVAEIAFDRTFFPTTAEVAVTVEGAWQHQGVGTELTRRAAMIARNRGATRLVMLCLVENLPMRRIARKLDSVLNFQEGAIAADLGLRRATPWSLFEELAQDGAGSWNAVTDRLLAPAAG